MLVTKKAKIVTNIDVTEKMSNDMFLISECVSVTSNLGLKFWKTSFSSVINATGIQRLSWFPVWPGKNWIVSIMFYYRIFEMISSCSNAVMLHHLTWFMVLITRSRGIGLLSFSRFHTTYGPYVILVGPYVFLVEKNLREVILR